MSKARFRIRRPSVQAPPFPLPAPKRTTGDFHDLTALILELWDRATFTDRTRMLQALDAACHQMKG